jgi:hypothetical protein
MTRKVRATRTINPLHFEDLEPHRFEDLVRRLLYGFREWTNIEATGRSGSDEGFDIRAWEKGEAVTNISDEGDEGTRDIDGRLWQIQGKREKILPPTKIRTVIRDGVDAATPPYGYILAAATNISKAGYDAFREELKKKGVTEFYFWGKDHLEDQLSLPQNDEILFTFFGLSFSPRRRSRVSEIKFNINNKNKILKLIFGNEHLMGQKVPRHKTFLLRDIKADHYPYKSAYPDFQKRRLWEEHDVVEADPNGVVFKIRERYAYLDAEKKKWDFSLAVDLVPRKHNIDQANEARLEEPGKRVERFWRHLPQRVQAKLVLYGFVSFEDMLIIDEKGDPEYTDPHVFIDFGSRGPFHRTIANLVQARKAFGEDEFEKFERVSIFPSSFPEADKGQLHEVEKLGLAVESTHRLQYPRGPGVLYSFDGKLSGLSVGNIIHIPAAEGRSEIHAEVTHIYSSSVHDFLEGKESPDYYRSQLQQDAGRQIVDRDELTVYEIHQVTLPYSGNLLTYLDGDW